MIKDAECNHENDIIQKNEQHIVELINSQDSLCTGLPKAVAFNAEFELKELLNKHKTQLDFWEDLEKHKHVEILFEKFVAIYLKARLPGDTYHLSDDVVPPHDAIKYGFDTLLNKGKDMGMDIVNIHKSAVAYECKWFHYKDTISFKPVVNKQYPINKTKIDRLIFCTNATKASRNVIEHVQEAGFMFFDEWITKEVFDIVKDFVNNQRKKVYKPMTPRDPFFKDALDDLETEVKKKSKNNKLPKSLRVLQHWPAASGKGSFPRLAYDQIFEPMWDYKKGSPINLVISPLLVVLKGNLQKQIEHDLALGNNSVHIVFTGADVRNAAANTEELQALRALTKILDNKRDLVDFIQTVNNQTIWIHTTPHNYLNLAGLMKQMKKQFFFAHIDEVHHLIQPNFSSWTAPLNDRACKIQVRLMSSANKRRAHGPGAVYSMDDPNFADLHVKELSEKTAVSLGYKRQSVLINYVYEPDVFNAKWIERIDEGSQPLIKLKGTNIVAPLAWFMNADALVRFRVEYSHYNHTKLTLNRIEDCVKFAEFLKAALPKLVDEYCGNTNDPVRNRLLKSKIIVADTAEYASVKLVKQINAIPHKYKDSFVIHCKLLGEGWDPENGWIDSNMFVDPTHSEVRIYQDVNRGSRIGDGSRKINYIIMTHLKHETNNFNAMYERIAYVGEVLEIGNDDITDQVFFKDVKALPKGKKMVRQVGSTIPTYYDEVEAAMFGKGFANYIKHGLYHGFGGLLDSIVWDYQKEFEARQLFWKFGVNDFARDQYLMFELMLKYKEFFDQYAKGGRQKKFEDIVQGRDFRISDNTLIQIVKWNDRMTALKNKRVKELQKYVDGKDLSDTTLTNYYRNTYKPKEVDPVFLKDNQSYFSIVYKYGDEYFKDLYKVNISSYGAWTKEKV
jgi:hypothetical protein